MSDVCHIISGSLTMQSQLAAVRLSPGETWLAAGGAEQSTDAVHCSHCSLWKVEGQAAGMQQKISTAQEIRTQ